MLKLNNVTFWIPHIGPRDYADSRNIHALNAAKHRSATGEDCRSGRRNVLHRKRQVPKPSPVGYRLRRILHLRILKKLQGWAVLVIAWQKQMNSPDVRAGNTRTTFNGLACQIALG